MWEVGGGRSPHRQAHPRRKLQATPTVPDRTVTPTMLGCGPLGQQLHSKAEFAVFLSFSASDSRAPALESLGASYRFSTQVCGLTVLRVVKV